MKSKSWLWAVATISVVGCADIGTYGSTSYTSSLPPSSNDTSVPVQQSSSCPNGQDGPLQAAVAVARVINPTGPCATVRRSGGNVIRAKLGGLLYSGDIFSTDAQSTITLQVLRGEGGTINASPNTDPLLDAAACFTISFFHRGTLEVNGHHICVQTDGGIVLVQDSDVIYSIISPGLMRVSVRQGHVSVVGRPYLGASTGQTFEVRGREVIGASFRPAIGVPLTPNPVFKGSPKNASPQVGPIQ